MTICARAGLHQRAQQVQRNGRMVACYQDGLFRGWFWPGRAILPVPYCSGCFFCAQLFKLQTFQCYCCDRQQAGRRAPESEMARCLHPHSRLHVRFYSPPVAGSCEAA